jgi:hypothetical protein
VLSRNITKVVVELVKQQGIWFNSLSPFFLVVTGSNPFAVVVRESDATKKGFYQFALWWSCGDGLAFQGSSYGSNQTFHSGWEPDGHAQGEKLHWLPLSPFLLRKKIKKKKKCFHAMYGL